MSTFAICMLVGVSLLGVSLGGVLLTRRLAAGREEYRYCRCRACQQKIRYAVSKIGKPAQCPRCQERFTLREELDDMPNGKRISVTLKRKKPIIGTRV